MSDQVNPDAVAAAVVTELTKDLLKSTLGAISESSKDFVAKNFPAFQKYLVSVAKRCEEVKIITNRDVPVRFGDIHVASFFQKGDKVLADTEVCDFVSANNRTVLSANGGAGKTFLMRFLMLKLFRQGTERIPLFVELRKIDALSSVNIVNFLRVNTFGADAFSEKVFEYFCQQGKFVFLLDGFDEISRSRRQEVEEQILDFSRKHPNCGIIVSGRPDDRFGGWQGFSTIRALPFEFSQFSQLIDKVPFEEMAKTNFKRVADAKFFEKHRSFLSNPLLALMMLITFRNNASIPDQLCTFYENCYSTMFNQHDSLKESFNRVKCLDQAQFKRVFSYFCLETYRDSRTSLDGAAFLEYIESARKLAGISETADAIAHDFLESVNLLVKEGTNFSFVHRSFQEFFAANCVVNVISQSPEQFLGMFAGRRNDRTFFLAHELHPLLVNDRFLFPLYRKLASSGKLPTRVDKTRPFKSLTASGVSFNLGIEIQAKKNRSSRKMPRLGFRRLSFTSDQDFSNFQFICSELTGDSEIDKDFSSLTFDIAAAIANFAEGDFRVALTSEDSLDVSIKCSYSEASFDVEIDDTGGILDEIRPDLISAITKKVEGVSLAAEKSLTAHNRRYATLLDEMIVDTNNSVVSTKVRGE